MGIRAGQFVRWFEPWIGYRTGTVARLDDDGGTALVRADDCRDAAWVEVGKLSVQREARR